MRKRLQSPLAAGFLVSLLVVLGILGLRNSGSLQSLELVAYDWFIRLRPETPGSDPRIVLITITESDIRNQGRWPITDATLAHALEMLTRYRPRAIGLDIYRDILVPPGRNALNAILTRHRQIITAMKFGDEKVMGIPPPHVLKHTDQVGFLDIIVDRDGIVRRGLLFLDDGETTVYAFALRLALLYMQAEGITPQPDPSNPQHLRLGQTTIRPFEPNDGGYVGADARGYQFLLDFQGARWEFPSYSLTTLLSGKIDPEAIKDKIVLIGLTAESMPDLFHTPYSSGHQVGHRMTGVVLHAQIASQLLRFGFEGSSPMATASEKQEALWILLWGVAGGALGLVVRSPWRFSVLGISGLLTLGLADYLVFLRGWWIPFVPPALAWLFAAGIVTAYMSNQEKQQRVILMKLFGQLVSQEVAEVIWQQRDQLFEEGRLRPQRLDATVLFTDLVEFTSVAEKLTPQALMDWLNEYMEAMSQQVMAHGGVINKYIGDSIMAIFGVPLARKSEAGISLDAVNTVNCALAMERILIQLNNRWREQQLPTAKMRIGIFTGPLVAGSLGSAQRLEYTVVGDTVNIASRLESFEKTLFVPDGLDSPCRILIGEATLCHLGHQFQTQRVGEVSLKGKGEKITIYRVVGRGDQTSSGALEEGRG
ncbi:MAG: adenylate/guanylate cyclase domain-containing protein [candidate division NC10 bacterium]|nr:adenylate/guanylate cyclase domain-containing protein [candidate division NC10 bacterium]